MQVTTRMRIVGGATGLLLAVTLGACGSPLEAAPATPTADVLVEPATPIETPTEAPEAVTYTTADGTTIQIDPTAPLPEAVLADVAAQVNADVAKFQDYPTDGRLTTEQSVFQHDAKITANDLSATLSDATGKTVFVAYGIYGSSEGMVYSTRWMATGYDISGVTGTESKDEIAADLAAWVAAQADPSGYMVIVP